MKFEDWDESILDADDYKVERALTNAALTAIHRARRFGTDFVIEENGQPKNLKPHETGPVEQLFLQDLERINRRIAELEAQNPSALVLNEQPEKKTSGGKAD
jgi:hypothetical protein